MNYTEEVWATLREHGPLAVCEIRELLPHIPTPGNQVWHLRKNGLVRKMRSNHRNCIGPDGRTRYYAVKGYQGNLARKTLDVADWLAEYGASTAREYAEDMDISRTAAEMRFRRAARRGWIHKAGKDNSHRYTWKADLWEPAESALKLLGRQP